MGPRSKLVREVIRRVCNRLIMEKDTITSLDQKIGDGDMGVNLADACAAVLKELDGSPDVTFLTF